MTEAEVAQVVNTLNLFAFTILTVIAFLRVIRRYIRWARSKYPPPRLLVRDLIMLAGMAWPFGLILLARGVTLAGWVDARVLPGSVLWAMATGVPAVVAMAIFVGYEYLVIGKDGDPPS